MKQKSINQKGFAVVEGLLILIIVGIVGGTGYYIYNAHKKTDDTFNSAAKGAQGQVPKTKKQATTKETSQPASAKVNDKDAIIAVTSEYIKTNFDSSPGVTYAYNVQGIDGSNARGGITPSEGDHQLFMAHKENGAWKIVNLSHLPPSDPALCTKYGMPADWCNGQFY